MAKAAPMPIKNYCSLKLLKYAVGLEMQSIWPCSEHAAACCWEQPCGQRTLGNARWRAGGSSMNAPPPPHAHTTTTHSNTMHKYTTSKILKYIRICDRSREFDECTITHSRALQYTRVVGKGSPAADGSTLSQAKAGHKV